MMHAFPCNLFRSFQFCCVCVLVCCWFAGYYITRFTVFTGVWFYARYPVFLLHYGV